MSEIVVGELAGACNNKTLTVVLKIRGDSTPAAGTGYAAGDFYKYTKVLALDANSEANANSVELTSANEVNTTSNANTFNNIWALHVSDAADGRCCRFYEKQPKSEKVFAENIQIRDEVAKYISWGIKILSRLRVMSLP